jgi:hypothetical protein
MFYIGFEKLSEFIHALDGSRQVYVAPLTLVKHNDYLSTNMAGLVASQIKNDHLIYCKVDTSRWQEIYGKPFGEPDRERSERARFLQEQMWRFVVEQIRTANPDLEIFDGTPSFPNDLLLVPGHADGVSYDADLLEFVKSEEIVP